MLDCNVGGRIFVNQVLIGRVRMSEDILLRLSQVSTFHKEEAFGGLENKSG